MCDSNEPCAPGMPYGHRKPASQWTYVIPGAYGECRGSSQRKLLAAGMAHLKSSGSGKNSEIPGMMRFVIRSYTVHTDKVRGSHCFVFLTDLHRSEFGPGNRDLIDAVIRLRPEAVFVGGDMIVAADAGKEPGSGNWYRNVAAIVEALSGRFPVYYAPGNHESQIIAPRNEESAAAFGDAGRDLTDALTGAGAVLLIDEHTELVLYGEQPCGEEKQLPDRIALYGFDIDGQYYRKFRYRHFDADYVGSHLGNPPDEPVYTVVMSHHPRYSDAVAEWGADLILSGHLHGGVLRLPLIGGVISPDPVLFPKYSDGMYDLRGRSGRPAHLIVSCGLGGHTVPYRINNPPEVSVVKIVPRPEEKQ